MRLAPARAFIAHPIVGLIAPCLASGFIAAPALAQTETIGSTAPGVYADDPEYRVPPIRFGSIEATTNASLVIAYDDNIYAEPVDPVDDVYLAFAPQIVAGIGTGSVKARFTAAATIKRYADRKTENSEAWSLGLLTNWSPSPASTLTLDTFARRVVEDRGDPEARIDSSTGPRLIDVLSATLQYRTAPGRMLLDVEAGVRRNDAVSSIDDDRDFTAFNTRATVGMRVTGQVYATATVFAVRREFRLEYDPQGIGRDTWTWGGRLGFDVQPGGPIEGNFSIGAFRYEPDDARTESRNGFSMAGTLSYRPTRRTAVRLSAMNGDVATFRQTARGRTDTRIGIAVDQEIRHNLLANVSFDLRKSKFVGSNERQTTKTASGEVEYIVGPHTSFALNAQYSDRGSNLPRERFERFRTMVSFRLRF